MKAKRRISIIGFSSLLFLCHAFDGNAMVASSSATIDWGSFSVAYISDGSNPPPNITWSDLSSSAHSSITSPTTSSDPFQNASNWSAPLSTHAGHSAAFSNTNITATTLHSHSEDSDLSPNSWPSSSSDRFGSFEVAGSGTLVFSANYMLDAAINSGVSATPSTPNQAISAAFIYGFDLTSNELLFKTEDVLGLNPGGPIGSPAHKEGTLSLTMLVNDGEQFGFWAGAQTNANVSVVPVPAAIWLFGSGLALISLKCRQA